MSNRGHSYNIGHAGHSGGAHVNFNGGIHYDKSKVISTVGVRNTRVSKHHEYDDHHNHNHMYYNYFGNIGGYDYYPFYYYNEIPYILDMDISSDRYKLIDKKCYDVIKKREIILEKGTNNECKNWCNSINENDNLVFSNMLPSSDNKCQCFIKTGKKFCS